MNFAHLQINQQQWQAAGQRLIEMAIAEFLYEEILSAEMISNSCYVLNLTHRQYSFVGYQYLLGHWHVELNSVRDLSLPDTAQPAWDLHAFILAAAEMVSVKPITKAYLIKEMNQTWLAEAHLFKPDRLDSQAVLCVGHDQIEGMLRGHPWIIMSKGRMGFAYNDYLTAAPELSPRQKLLWLAVHRNLAEYRATSDWSADRLYEHELNLDERQKFKALLLQKHLNPQDYYFIPVHAWQWHEWIISTYANEMVNHNIIVLGEGEDEYVPMQSIRTLSNRSQPQRHYVKLPVSILNTAVYRGLPSQRNLAAPALSQWLKQIHRNDAQLQHSKVIFLAEIATLTIQQPCFDSIDGAPYQFKELFGCLWRESVVPYLQPKQQVLSQAALLHRDLKGQSVLQVLIHASGLSPQQWLKQFAAVCLSPLLLCLYRYGLAFSPHGENTMLVHEQGRPKALVIKDFIDDVNLVDANYPELNDLPQQTHLLLRHRPEDLTHFIFTGLFMVHYRYICNVMLQDYPDIREVDFWQIISDVIQQFHANHPELADRIQQFDVLRPQFEKICLNRVRLFTTGYNDEAERPVPVFLAAMSNPVSPTTLATWALPKQSQPSKLASV